MNYLKTTDKDLLASLKRDVLTSVIPVLEKQSERIDLVEQKVEKFAAQIETQVFLNQPQATALKKAVERRIRNLLPSENDYMSQSRKMFRALWCDLKELYQVPGYREIPRVHFQNAMLYVENWQPIKLAKPA